MHVLILPSWYTSDESFVRGIFFKEQAKALQAAGIKVGVVYTDFRSLRTLPMGKLLKNRFQVTVANEDGIPTIRCNGWNLPRMELWNRLWVRISRTLINIYIQKFGIPDLIHAHSALYAGVAAQQVSKILGIPYLITEHSSVIVQGKLNRVQYKLASSAYREAKSVIAVSSAVANSLCSWQLTMPAQMQVIPNVVNTDFFQLVGPPPSSQVFRFLAIGNLIKLKGIDVLLRSFSRIVKHLPNVLLEIAGDGPERNNLESLAHELGIYEKVKFLGALRLEDVRSAIYRANILVHPSLYETFGVVLIEALACGKPVIATDCGGPSDIVAKDVGIIIPAGDEAKLASAMLIMQKKYAVYDPHQLRNYVINNFSNLAVIPRLTELYENIAKVAQRIA